MYILLLLGCVRNPVMHGNPYQASMDETTPMLNSPVDLHYSADEGRRFLSSNTVTREDGSLAIRQHQKGIAFLEATAPRRTIRKRQRDKSIKYGNYLYQTYNIYYNHTILLEDNHNCQYYQSFKTRQTNQPVWIVFPRNVSKGQVVVPVCEIRRYIS